MEMLIVTRQGFEIISAKKAFEHSGREDIIFIDLRSREEFEERNMGNAFCLRNEQIEAGDFWLAKEYGYVLYCNRGGASMRAAKILGTGEVPIYTLAGGMEEYEIFMRSLVDRKRGKL